MKIKIPELPALSSRVPTEVRNALIKLHQALKSADASGGLATAADVSGASSSIASDVADAIAEITAGPSAVPGAPVNFTATGAFNQILLKVDSPNQDDQVEYTEFLRATVDDPNQADVVACISGTSYPDTPPDSRLSVNYYYWARFVNVIGTGPLNATAGTISSTADEPGYILDTLVADKWQAATAYDVDMVVTPGNVDGRALKCTVAGVSGASEPTWPTVIGNTVVDDGATWELVATDVTLESIFKIALVSGNWVAAIKAAFIQDLTAENFVAKEIVADKISTALAESYQQVIGWLLRSSDSLVSLDMSSKVLKMQDAGSGDYVQMTPGDLTFVYNQDVYKSVRRIVAGYGSNNTYIPFDPPFKTAPTVLLSQRDLMSYDAGESGASQSIIMNPGTVTKDGFTPLAQLIFSGQAEFYYDTTDDIATNGNYAYANTGSYVDVTRVGATVKVGQYVCEETPDSGTVCNWTNVPDRIRLYYSYNNSTWVLFHDETITGSNLFHNWSLYGTHTFYTPTLTSNKIYIRLIVTDASSVPSATLIGLYVTRSGYSTIANGDINYIAIEGGY